MSYDDNGDLGRALAALDIFTVWTAAYRDGATLQPAPQRDGVYKSPFREDGTKGSFSVINGGRGFKDHGGAGIAGGSWRFCQLCWPHDTKADTARRVIELSGITPTERSRPAVGAAVPPLVGGVAVDERLLRAAKSIERRRKADDAITQVYTERDKKLLPPKFQPVSVWPECVAKRWLDGVDALAADEGRMGEIAKSRGWPIGWVDDLVVAGKIACPWDRGATPGARYAARQRAFIVEQPRMAPGGGVVLDRVGYHQHWYMAAREEQPAAKGWLYVPSTPKRMPRGDFERELLAYAIAHGSTQESPRSLVPALPFVLGDLVNTRLIVLLEGQWDAITFYGACGFLENELTYGEGRKAAAPEGIAVFGIRGAQGMDVFLGAWAQWLRRLRPRAWVIADNDAAGGSWRDQPEGETGLPRPPSLGDRLIAAGCGGGEHDESRAPVISWLKKGNWGKDFNDYFKGFGGNFGPDKIAGWMRARGIDISPGGRA